MMDTPERSKTSITERLRADAARLDGGPSEAAQGRLRAALSCEPMSSRRSTQTPRAPRVILVLAAAALAVFLVRGAWSPGPDAPYEDTNTVRIAMPAILGSLLSARPIDAVEYVTAGPLRDELDALALDAVAVAEAMLRRIPSPLVPNRQTDARAD